MISLHVVFFPSVCYVGRGSGGLYKAPTKKEASERLREKREGMTSRLFILDLKRQLAVGFWE